MELPKSKWEFITEGSKFILRLPLLYLSYRRNAPLNIAPLSVDINITDRCNFRCLQCRGAAADYQPKDEIDTITMKKILDDMAEIHIPYLTISGGEPLLRYDFVLETIEYAQYHGIKAGMVTNSSLLTEDKLTSLVDAGLHRIAISLDGATRETHDLIRMPGSFDKIMADLILCQELKRRKSFRLHINTVVMRQNFRQLLEIARITRRFTATAFYQPVGVPQIYPLGDTALAPTTGVESLVIKGKELDELAVELRKLIDFKKRYGVVGDLNWQLRNILSYYKSLETGRSLIKFKCYSGFNTIHINSDGEFCSCIFMPSVGNIHNTSIKEAWLSKEYYHHRKLIQQCTRPCAANCYYPISFPSLAYEFLFLPLKRRLQSQFQNGRDENVMPPTIEERVPCQPNRKT